MKRKHLILVGLFVVLALAAFFFLKPKQRQPEDTTSTVAEQMPLAATAPAAVVNDVSAEISFTKSILIQSKTYSIDGGEKKELPCPPEGISFATIKLSATTTATLTCAIDYLGGVKIRFKDVNNEDKYVELSQQDGDAGDSWDFRSIILKNPDGSVKIETLSFTTSTSTETENAPTECLSKKFAFSWNEAVKDFSESDSSGTVTEDMFDPPTALLTHCQGPNGKWRDTVKD